MFSRRLELSSETDGDALVMQLRADAEAQGISPDALREMLSSVEPLVRMMLDNGRKIAATGGQFQAGKEIKGDEFRVRINADFGARKRGLLGLLFGKRGS